MLEQNNGAEGAQNTAVNKPQNTWEIFKELFQEIVNRDPDRSTIPIFQLLGSQGPRALIDLMTGVAQQIPGSVMNKVILFGWPDQSSNISSLSQVTLKIPMNATDIIKAKADIANLTDVLVAEINRSPDGKINILMKPSWKPEVTYTLVNDQLVTAPLEVEALKLEDASLKTKVDLPPTPTEKSMVAASVSERTQWMPVIAPLPDKQLITSGRIDSFQDPQTLQHTRYFAIFGSNVKDELSIYLGSYQNQSNLSLELNTDQIRVSFINQAPHQGFLANLPEGAFFIPTHIIAPAFSRPPQFVMFFGPDAKTPLQNVQVWLN